MHQHNNTTTFRYETTSQMWGGFKDRAFEALSKVTILPQSESSFFDYLQQEYPQIYNAIEWAKFYAYSYKLRNQPKKFNFRQVVINLKPLPSARDLLFNEREKITLATSWYPSVTGSRAWINNRMWNSNAQLKSIGLLERIIPIENSDKIFIDGKPKFLGTSFKLLGTNGAILLDCGLIGDRIERNGYSFIFLSHYHRDHGGGLVNAIDKNPRIPIVTSRTSFAYFEGLSFIPPYIKDKLKNNVLLPEQVKTISFKNNCSYSFFPVYHAPGSYGVKVTDDKGTHLTFLGDLCLRNGFYSPYEELLQRIYLQKGKNNYVLIDCAMINLTEQIDIDDKPASILKKISEEALKRNVFIVSNQIENIIYSYMLTFSISSKIDELKQVKIIVSQNLYRLIRTLLEPLIFGNADERDPIANLIVGESKMNFIETHRLYPLTEEVLNEIPEEEKCIYFISESDLQMRCLLKRIRRIDEFIVTGKMAFREGIPEGIQKLKPRSTLNVCSEDWSFHSRESDLVDFIKDLTKEGITSLLFHKSEYRLNEFIEKYQLDKQYVNTIGNKPYSLR